MVTEVADAPDTTETPYSISVDEVFYGSLSGDSDEDLIAVTFEAGVFYRFSANLWDSILRLYDARGVLLKDYGAPHDNDLSYFATTGGTYYLGYVSRGMYWDSHDFPEAYTLSYHLGNQETKDAPADTTTGYMSQYNSTFIGKLESPSDVDWIKISKGYYNVYETSSPDGEVSDTVLAIYDASGRLLVTDDDGGDGQHARIAFTALAGETYFLAVSGKGETGTYDLRTFYKASLAGSTGNDFLHETSRKYSFPTHMKGLAGDDTIYGNKWASNLYGGAGDDRLFGGAGPDRLNGDPGNDMLAGGLGKDILFGGKGHDRLKGGPGADDLYGNEGRDRLIGGVRNDILRGEEGRDRLAGGRGDDTLIGGLGNDRLSGGDGKDVFVFGRNGGRDVIRDFDVTEDILNLRRNFGPEAADPETLLDEIATVRNGNAFLKFDSGDVLVLKGVDDLDALADRMERLPVPPVESYIAPGDL